MGPKDTKGGGEAPGALNGRAQATMCETHLSRGLRRGGKNEKKRDIPSDAAEAESARDDSTIVEWFPTYEYPYQMYTMMVAVEWFITAYGVIMP